MKRDDLVKLAAGAASPPLDELLDETAAFLAKYIHMPDPQVVVCALWVAHCWTFRAFDVTPYLNVTSPEKECGKTNLGILLARLVPYDAAIIGASPAALYRTIQKHEPALIIDELDQAMSGDKERIAGVIEIVNAGYTRGATVRKCVPPKWEVEEFAVFCPKVLIGIGDLPDTTASRSIRLTLQRKRRGQLGRFRLRRVKGEAAPIQDGFEAWAKTVDLAALGERELADDQFPPALSDRGCDVWEPLLLLAEMAGGEWHRRALQAAGAVGAGAVGGDDSYRVRMLAAFRAAFDQDDARHLSTHAVILGMAHDEEAPWSRWVEYRDGGMKPVQGAAAKLANGLKPFGIRSHDLWDRDQQKSFKGYRREDAESAFAAYLPDPSRESCENPHGYGENEGSASRGEPSSLAGSGEAANPHGSNVLAALTASSPGEGDTGTAPATNGDGSADSEVGAEPMRSALPAESDWLPRDQL
jgi:Protein of unknown function (DUF3631)